ncbi:MAG: hypothetical protein H6713_25885 [Myxococcales bacterium]|nr:hypothetical protein [Myxococcales bacterium]
MSKLDWLGATLLGAALAGGCGDDSSATSDASATDVSTETDADPSTTAGASATDPATTEGTSGTATAGPTDASTDATDSTSDPTDATDSTSDPTDATTGDPSETTGAPAVCGDGLVEGDEACDDGPDNADDAACTSQCTIAACGDGFVLAGVEECDAGPDNADDAACTSQCAAAYCGDGLVWAGTEDCDDADELDNGCTNECAEQRARELAVGHFHVCAILSGGAVKCWGANHLGYLGLGDTERRGDEPDEMGANLPFVDLGADAVAVKLEAGSGNTCAVLEGGALKCWGRNDYGQLGLGHAENVGDEPGEMGDDLPTVDLGAGVKVVDVAAGHYHACALLEGGDVKCWGHDSGGQLGLGGSPQACGNTDCRGVVPEDMGDNLPTVDLGAGQKAIAITAGFSASCALLEGGDVKCWGAGLTTGQGDGVANVGDDPGEMGDNLPPIVLGAPALDVHAGIGHVCARLDGLGVKCWGGGAQGALGSGSLANIGVAPGEMAALDPVDLGGLTDAALTSGRWTSCALSEDGAIKCWGYNNYGQLGLGDLLDRGDEPGEMGANLPLVDLDAIAVQVDTSFHATCALLEDGAIKCWGRNLNGELGQGDTVDRGGQPGQMGANLPTIKLYSETW